MVPPYSGREVRHRSPASIVSEIGHCVDKYDIRWFYFFADTFTVSKENLIGLCRGVLEEGLKISFFGNARVDTVDDEMAGWLSEAGCQVLSFGVESGNDETLRRIGKRITTRQTREAIKVCRRHGIASNAFVVLGFPWERREDVLATIDFIFRLDPDFAQFLVPIPIPGTPMHELYRKRYPHLADWQSVASFENFTSSAVRTEDLTAEELDAIRKKAATRFYLRPRKVLSTLRRQGFSTALRAGPILLNRLLG